jgi:hypothetical protein
LAHGSEASEMNERRTATGFAAWLWWAWRAVRLAWHGVRLTWHGVRLTWHGVRLARRAVLSASLARACLLLILVSTPRAALAQSCPNGYAACDNGVCCRSSDQCCPNSAECCDSFAPFCCGDGTCAVSPGQCAGAVGQSCNTYEVPCGAGCAPPGSDCCDSAGHYCAIQGVCTSNTTCIAGTEASAALLVTPVNAGARSVSPLRDPPDGSARSCALAQAFARRGSGDAGASSAAEMAAALLLCAYWARRGARRASQLNP